MPWPARADEDGTFELEGELKTLRLPTTLDDSIRMRLAAVRERDPDLDRLLRLASVMAGSFTRDAMLRVWRTLAPEQALNATIQRGVKKSFLKFLTASGNTDTGSARRRSSAASGAVGRFVFSHLRINDNVLDLLLR